MLQDVLGWWQRNGLGGYAVTGFAQIDASNIALVQQCIAYFGAVYAGLVVPQSAQQQFDANEPWSVVRGSPIEGGTWSR